MADETHGIEIEIDSRPSEQGKQRVIRSLDDIRKKTDEIGKAGADALFGGKVVATMPLDGMERITIDGVEYEAFNTSGGVATMCETFAGKVPGFLTPDEALSRHYIDLGGVFMAVGLDVNLLARHTTALAARFKNPEGTK